MQLPLSVVRMVVWLSGTLLNLGDLNIRFMLPDLVESLSIGESLERVLKMSLSESWTLMEMDPELVEKSIRSWRVYVPEMLWDCSWRMREREGSGAGRLLGIGMIGVGCGGCKIGWLY